MPFARGKLRIWGSDWKESVKLNLAAKFGAKRQKYFPSLMQRYEKIFRRQGAEKDKNKISRNINIMRNKIKKFKFQNVTQWSTYQSNWVTNDRHVVLYGGGQPIPKNCKYGNVPANKKYRGVSRKSRNVVGYDSGESRR